MKIAAVNKVESKRTITVVLRRSDDVRPGHDMVSLELTEEEATKLYAELRRHVGYRTQP